MTDSNKITVSTFYDFFPFTKLEAKTIQDWILNFAESSDLMGLVLVGHEGINGTVSGPHESVEKLKAEVRNWVKKDLPFKDSFCQVHPFHEMKVKIKKEIVTLGRPDLVPKGVNHHLPPKEWDEMMGREDVVVIDTRNDYETRIGKFKNAVDLNITDFHDFPLKVKELNLPKEKNVLMYCTGGIRCEKAILEMQEQGYNKVFQLEGGILNYLKDFPEGKFEGECFVFDYRVAVDQKLKPSEAYRLCPHCGQPTDHVIDCMKCHTKAHVCKSCIETGADKETCSKNCAHHFRIDSRSTRTQLEGFRQQPKRKI